MTMSEGSSLSTWHQKIRYYWATRRKGVILKSRVLDFGQKNAPFIFSAFSAILNRHIQFWLGEDGHTICYLDDNRVVCRADRIPGLLYSGVGRHAEAVRLQTLAL